jgi:hypothetical protein
VFCVHDADAHGTVIYQTLQEATTARKARKIDILDFGLQPWEAIENGLAVETIDAPEKRRPVADYVTDREDTAPDGNTWDEWLQTHRIELNAMTTPQFIAWLDGKMAEHGDGKLIPPSEVIVEELDKQLKEDLSEAIRERILEEADFDGQVEDALDKVERPADTDMVTAIQARLETTPTEEWREYIRVTSAVLTAAYEPDGDNTPNPTA